MGDTETTPEVMLRIAAPMVEGTITALLLLRVAIPAAYLLMLRPRERQATGRRFRAKHNPTTWTYFSPVLSTIQ